MPIVQLNGAAHATDAATLADLVAGLDLPAAVVATAVNGDFVPRDGRAAVPLADGDRVEVVSPRQGG